MKHVFSCLLVVVMLSLFLSPGGVIAEELTTEPVENLDSSLGNSNTINIIDSYAQALSSNHWKVIADSGRGGSCLSDIYDYWPEIYLSHDDIALYKNAVGQIFITFVKTEYNLSWVAEIIFAQDMKSFILYSADCAIIGSMQKFVGFGVSDVRPA